MFNLSFEKLDATHISNHKSLNLYREIKKNGQMKIIAKNLKNLLVKNIVQEIDFDFKGQ